MEQPTEKTETAISTSSIPHQRAVEGTFFFTLPLPRH